MACIKILIIITNDKYDPDGFEINGINKDTGTFLNRRNFARDDIYNNINWLENKNEFLNLYKEIIKKGEFTGTADKNVISSKIFKDLAEDILNGKIKNNNKKEIYKKRLDNVKKDLSKSKKNKNVNQLKDYLTKIKNLLHINDKEEPQNTRDRIRTDEARSYKDQKGSGYINLPIILSKLNINNSKELKTNIKNLSNHLYDTKQITNQVHNSLIKAITYKNDS